MSSNQEVLARLKSLPEGAVLHVAIQKLRAWVPVIIKQPPNPLDALLQNNNNTTTNNDEIHPKECAQCGYSPSTEAVEKKKKNLMRCSNCKLVYYCSRTCQEHHWSIHKKACKDPHVDQKTVRLRPFIFVIADRTSEAVLFRQVINQSDLPSAAHILGMLQVVIITKVKSRPRQITLSGCKQLAETISATLTNDWDVPEVAREDPPQNVKNLIQKTEKELSKNALPDPKALSEVEGVTIELLRSLYRGAAEFFKLAPWRYLKDLHVLHVSVVNEGRSYQEERVVSIMGNKDPTTRGVSVFSSMQQFKAYARNPFAAVQGVVEGMTYGSQYNMTFKDLDDIEEHELEIAPSKNKSSYPGFFIFNKMTTRERPSYRDLLWYDAALKAMCKLFSESPLEEQREKAIPPESRYEIEGRGDLVTICTPEGWYDKLPQLIATAHDSSK